MDDILNKKLTANFEDNLNTMKNIFSYPANKDFIVRELHILAVNKKGVLLCLNTIVDKEKVDNHIISPLIYTKLDKVGEDIGVELRDRVLSSKSVNILDSFQKVIKGILDGDTILLVEGYPKAIHIYTAKQEHRNVEKSTIENTLKGPKEAFIEWNEGNRSLIRKVLKNPNLVTEVIETGEEKYNEVFVMYIKDLVNDELLTRVKDRINSVKDVDTDRTSIFEQIIEEKPYSILPSTFVTERPDRTVAFLKEGHIAILLDSSPDVMIVPVTFWSFFHTAEDMYQRWLYGNFLRLIRTMGFLVALLLPGVYIAVTTFHPDMIPTDLVIAIAAAREKLPFPVLIELLLMEISFELIREAGVRIPTNIGPTIGIVGALILGQAAVEANIVSPILVIVVALTGLASFAIPEINLGFIARIGRFIALCFGAVGGFYGLGLIIVLFIGYASSFESFGVPFFSPKAPYFPSSKDLIFRLPILKQKQRPMNLKPKKSER